MKKTKRKKGISLIALIITIIVIILLAAIVMMASGETVDEADFAKFVSEFGDFHSAVVLDFANREADLLDAGIVVPEKAIFYAIANNEVANADTKAEAKGKIEDLGKKFLPEDLEGTEYYEITSQGNVSEWERERTFYSKSEKLYVTDKGEVFTLPGFPRKQGEEQRYYVNEKKYYNDGYYELPDEITVSNVRITDVNGDVVSDKVIEGNTLYINFDAVCGEETVTISPNLPYPVTSNGTYSFTIEASNGKTLDYTVTVDNFIPRTLLNSIEIGDYVQYNTITSANWRVWDIVGDDVIIVPTAPVGTKLSFSGLTGYTESKQKIIDECKKYVNASLGITAADITSMTREDIEAKTQNISAVKSEFRSDGGAAIGGTKMYTSGTHYTYEGTSGTMYYPASPTKVATESSQVKVKQTDYDLYFKKPSSKNPTLGIWKNSVYSEILGSTSGWLATTCEYLYEAEVHYCLNYVNNELCMAKSMYTSTGTTKTPEPFGVRPMIKLNNSRLEIVSGDGSSASAAWVLKTK